MEIVAVNDFVIVVGKVFSFALSLLLIVLVLLQKEKGGGLAGAFGGGGSIATFGVKTSDVAAKITWWIFVIWLITSLALAIFTRQSAKENLLQNQSDTPSLEGAPTPGESSDEDTSNS